MTTQQGKQIPITVNLDTSYENMQPTEAVAIHNYSLETESNGGLSTGTGNDTGEGQNEFTLKPVKSNKAIDVEMPAGTNICVGQFESLTTRELYYFNYNGNGNHCICVLSADTLQWNVVIIDTELEFSENPTAFIANHRVSIRVTYNKEKGIVEKYLIWTDGNVWQGWISVKASIATNGFNSSTYPYWTLKQPHFDRKELFQYAVRPPMYKPEVRLLDNTYLEANRPNRMIDKAFQFSYSFVLTDGRETTLSPYSLPMIVKSEVYLANPQAIPKRGEIELYGGSPLVEKVRLFVRQQKTGLWYLYDTISKYTDTGANDPIAIGEEYWLRTNPYADYDYDGVFNTFKYIFSFDRVYQIFDQETANIYQNRLPIRNMALSDLGDAILMGNNEYDYDNFSQTEIDKFSVEEQEKESDACQIPTRNIRLYAMAVAMRDDAGDNGITQVGYKINEDDTQVRFGGFEVGIFGNFNVYTEDSVLFNLDFADRESFRCYLKGTEYYSDGQWHFVDENFNLEPINSIYNVGDEAIKYSIQEELRAKKMFVCVFDFVVPAGIYVATIGRHNEASSGDWRNKSTYIAGIANSRLRTIRSTIGSDGIATMPYDDTIVSRDKEIEINCLGADVDVWGNGSDVFWIFSPYQYVRSNNPIQRKYKLIEGYLLETPNPNDITSVEYFPYNITEGFPSTVVTGEYTDKNGFFFGYSADGDAREANINVWGKKDCVYQDENDPIYEVEVGIGNYIDDAKAYLSNTTLGDCNRILVRGNISNATGTFGYSNVSVHIFGGAVATTDQNGDFTLVVHNGLFESRTDKIYISASSNYTIRNVDCSVILPYDFNEGNPDIACVYCNERLLEPTELFLNVNIASGSGQQSLKANGKYPVAIVGFDLAGRATFANKISEQEVQSFLQRDNTNPTEMIWALANALNLPEDIKWLGVYVAPNVNYGRYVQWVGDSVEFLDNRGEVTTDTATAAFAKINIESLLETNIRNNFTLLADYQFVKGDRLRIFDDGEGNLFDTATYGEPIDAEIYGTNYNEAAIRAGLVKRESQLVINEDANVVPDPTTLIIKYDKRLDVIQDKTGFWIEIYQPALVTDALFYGEVTVYPVVNGTIAEFTGFTGSTPQYDYLLTDTIPFWDTYFVDRSIVSSSTNFLPHPFESPNITDLWGQDYISSGRVNIENKEAKRRWFRDDTIRSDEFANDGVINGLALFREGNRKTFKGYLWGGITAMIPQRSIILFLCENDWFTASYNLNYARVDSNGNFIVVNLDQSLGEPNPKVGSNYGCEYEDTRSIVFYEGMVGWHDMKNGGYIVCNYQDAMDITEVKEGGRGVGINSYYRNKTEVISKWNSEQPINKRVDVTVGIDLYRNDVVITFRPRRENSTRIQGFVNQRRGYSFHQQETFIYNLERQRWTRTTAFTPEAYASLRGRSIGVEFISFANGIPYRHNDNSVRTFCTFYGIQTERYITICINQNVEANKVLQSLSLDSNRQRMFADLIYGNEPYSFSRISINKWVLKENLYFAEVMMDESTYPPVGKDAQYQSMLFDGKPMYGLYFIVRLVGDPLRKDEYQELNGVYFKVDNREASLQK